MEIGEALGPVAIALSFLWIVLCGLLHSLAKRADPDLFEALGRPHLLLNNRPIHSVLLLRFLYTPKIPRPRTLSLRQLRTALQVSLPPILGIYLLGAASVLLAR